MHSRFACRVLLCGLFLVPSPSSNAQLPLPTPSLTPAPSVTPPAEVSIQYPTPTPTILSGTAEENIPVVITYGDGAQTHAQITRGVTNPIGVPVNQPVTVTLFLTSAIPGTPLKAGLYDGGQVAPAVSTATPTPAVLSGSGDSVDASPILVLADRTVSFNFRSGGLFGLYRVLLTIGPKQYLMQFFAVKPRAVANPVPAPPPIATPPPDG